MKLYNTLSRAEEVLPNAIEHETLSFYACGPTVYDETHIGHMRKYAMDDILFRTLEYLGYKVNHVMNITDVGHLTGDDDSGDDKLEKGAKKQGKTVWEIAQFYTDKFFETMDALNINRPTHTTKATDHIQDMINLIKQLEEKGYTYQSKETIYFDVTKFENYGKLSGQKLEDKKQAVREEVNIDPDKKHPADFALWFFRTGRFADHTMHWESPWGDGFPGWHIECSAMSMKYLGEQIDIHSGGIDHIPVHHENEIAQSEAATGKKPFVRYWMHHAFLQVEGEKMSKSKGNFYTLKDILDQHIDPLAMRYLFLQTHYRKPMNFTWESVKSANYTLYGLKKQLFALKQIPFDKNPQPKIAEDFRTAFKQALEEDLNMSEALATLWNVVKSPLSSREKITLTTKFEKVLGLNLLSWEPPKNDISGEAIALAEKRIIAKKQKNFEHADELRAQIESLGYTIEDTKDGYDIKKK